MSRDATSPEARERFLLAEQRRARLEQRVNPPLTGDLFADIELADNAVASIESEFDAADGEYRAAQRAMPTIADPEEERELLRLQRTRDQLWAARQQAVRNRDRLLSREQAWSDEAWHGQGQGQGF